MDLSNRNQMSRSVGVPASRSEVSEDGKIECVAGMATIFSDLMTEILSNVSLTLAELSPYKSVRKKVQQIETLALRGKNITDQLLTYSGRGKCVVLPVNLNDIVEDMKHLSWILHQGTTLRYDLDYNLTMIEADARQIRKLIVNLVANAADSVGDEQGMIRISTGITHRSSQEPFSGQNPPAGAYVYLEVSDNGCGIDEEIRAKMFDPFFATKPKARGLGLSEVLGIVRSHRGVVEVEGAWGQGTTIRVLIPEIES